MKTNLLLAAVTSALLFTSTALAQGTATGPFTAGIVISGPEVLIGDPNNPIPIPEPGSFALAAVSSLVLLGMKRRR